MNPQWEVQCSSKSVEYPTPRPLFDALHAEFKFDVDVCATAENACLPRYFTAEQDGLAQDWSGMRCYMNPPYGRGLTGKWVRKAAESARVGALVVALLPSRTDVQWWHDYIWDVETDRPRPGVEVRFIKGRVTFVGADAPAPFASVVVVFHAQCPAK